MAVDVPKVANSGANEQVKAQDLPAIELSLRDLELRLKETSVSRAAAKKRSELDQIEAERKKLQQNVVTVLEFDKDVARWANSKVDGLGLASGAKRSEKTSASEYVKELFLKLEENPQFWNTQCKAAVNLATAAASREKSGLIKNILDLFLLVLSAWANLNEDNHYDIYQDLGPKDIIAVSKEYASNAEHQKLREELRETRAQLESQKQENTQLACHIQDMKKRLSDKDEQLEEQELEISSLKEDISSVQEENREIYPVFETGRAARVGSIEMMKRYSKGSKFISVLGAVPNVRLIEERHRSVHGPDVLQEYCLVGRGDIDNPDFEFAYGVPTHKFLPKSQKMVEMANLHYEIRGCYSGTPNTPDDTAEKEQDAEFKNLFEKCRKVCEEKRIEHAKNRGLAAQAVDRESDIIKNVKEMRLIVSSLTKKYRDRERI